MKMFSLVIFVVTAVRVDGRGCHMILLKIVSKGYLCGDKKRDKRTIQEVEKIDTQKGT